MVSFYEMFGNNGDGNDDPGEKAVRESMVRIDRELERGLTGGYTDPIERELAHVLHQRGVFQASLDQITN
jgi:hypothetical protein